MTKRSSPYLHSDGSGCWTRNCSLGHRSSVESAASSGNLSAFLDAKLAAEVKPDAAAFFGTSAPSNRAPAKPEEWKNVFGSRPSDNPYYLSHRAPDGLEDDETAKGAHELTRIFPDDVLAHPDWYCGDVDPQAVSVLKKIQGNPNAMVTIFRSVPHGVDKINNGDWVSLSRKYAVQHGMQDDPADDWGVLEAKIPARFLWSEGNDLNEFGVSFPD